MSAVLRPGPLVEVPAAEGREVASAARSGATLMSDSADSMHRHAAPADWEGDEAALAGHVLTATSRAMDAAVAALVAGIAALDRFSDRVDELRPRRDALELRRQRLVQEADALEVRSPDDPELEQAVAAHGRTVVAYESDAAALLRDLRAAEDVLVAALSSVDTPGEARQHAARQPDVPALAAQADERRGDPVSLNAWWHSLGRAQREALKIARPELVGNLDGLPAVERDEANRSHLTSLRERLDQRRDDGGWSEADERLDEQLAAVERALLEGRRNLTPALLLALDPMAAHGDGHAAVAYGDPDRADRLAVHVPGMMNDLASIDNLALLTLDVHLARSGDVSVANVAWLGYDPPSGDLLDLAQVVSEGKAEAGAEQLSRFIDGLDASRGRDAHETVIGHSYGSTTVAKAAGDDMRVDDVVLLGSPGAGEGNDEASDLHGTVWAASADNDPVTRLGDRDSVGPGLGTDPASDGFGAQRIDTPAGEPVTFSPSSGDEALRNHRLYYSQLSEQLAAVVEGRDSQVRLDDGRHVANPVWWMSRGGSTVPAETYRLLDDAADALAGLGLSDVLGGVLR